MSEVLLSTGAVAGVAAGMDLWSPSSPAIELSVTYQRSRIEDSVQLFVLPLGEIDAAAEVMLPGFDDGGRIRFPVHSYLVKRHDGHHVLIDTGMNDGHVENPDMTWRDSPLSDLIRPVVTKRDTILARLAEVNVTPDQIAVVINTHLHFDHAGNNALFTKARFAVQREHYAFARANPDLFPSQYWDVSEDRFDLIDGEAEVVAGVRVIPSPGHARGHQSVLVEMDADRLLLCGDAVQCHQNFDHDNWAAQTDPEIARETGDLLRTRAAAAGARLVYAHDSDQDLLLSPDSYS